MVFSLSALWWRRVWGLWKLPDGTDWLRGKLGLVLMDGAKFSKSLIQFSIDGWACVPSLLFTRGQTMVASLVAQMVKHLPAMRETQVWSLGKEDPLEKEMATHSSTLAWKIPWMEEPGRLQSMGSRRVRHDWATSLSLSHYDGGNEDNGDFLQKVPCMHCYTQCPQPCSRPPPTHATTRDSWILMGKSGLVSCGVTAHFSWVLEHTWFCLCAPRVCFPVLCKFWWLCGGVNGDLLQGGLCHTQVCCIQSPCSSPLLTCTSTGDTDTQFCLSLCGVSGSWCAQGLSEPSECFWRVWGLILNTFLLLLSVSIWLSLIWGAVICPVTSVLGWN